MVLVEAAPAKAQRDYDWGAKITFALSVGELGKLISNARRSEISFVHDPNKGREAEGTVVKNFKMSRMGSDTGFFVTLSRRGYAGAGSESISVPIDDSEFAVMDELFRYSIPRKRRLCTPTTHGRCRG